MSNAILFIARTVIVINLSNSIVDIAYYISLVNRVFAVASHVIGYWCNESARNPLVAHAII